MTFLEWTHKLITSDNINDGILSHEYEIRISRLRGELNNLEMGFRNKYPRYMQIREPQIIELDDARQILDEKELIIYYWEVKDYLFAFTLNKNGHKTYSFSIDNKKFKIEIEKLKLILDNKLDSDIFKKYSYSIYNKVLEPIINDFSINEIENICIIGQGSLANMPFESLIFSNNGSDFNNFDYVFKKFNVSYVSSLSTLSALRKFPKTNNNLGDHPFLAFGNPALDQSNKLKFFQDFELLPFSKYEVEYISLLFYKNTENKHIYLGPKATKINLNLLNDNNKLSRYKFIHFATHAIIQDNFKNFTEPYLVLSPDRDKQDNGLLKQSEIFNLKLNADMVTLSACNTGIEIESDLSQGLSELSRAFFLAGTSRLTVALWSVNDEGTSEFMKRYYNNLLMRDNNKTSYVKALNETKLQMIETKKYCHPYYWAPFIMVGEWR